MVSDIETMLEVALQFADQLRNTVAQLRIANSESIAVDHFTATVVAIAGRLDGDIDGTPLLTKAISTLANAKHAIGDRVIAIADTPPVLPVLQEKKVQIVRR